MPAPQPVNPIINPDAAAAELCRRDFFFFVQEFWDVLIPEEPVWNWHIEYFCSQAQEIIYRLARREIKVEDLIINVPPGSTKSTIWSVMLPAWAWTVDPSLRILTMAYSEKLAMSLAVKSRTLIQSDRYRKYFPEVQIKSDQNNKTDYENTRQGQRYAAGLSGSVTGQHFHLILIDDPLNPKEAASLVECANASTLIDSTVSTRKVDKAITVTILIMQRLAEQDPTGNWLSKKDKKIRHICLPAEAKVGVKPKELAAFYTDGLLDPVRIGHQVISEAKIDLGAAGYAGQFDQRPAPAGGLIWKKWFIEVPDHLFPDKKHMSLYGTDWDLAYTKNDENAASAYISAGKIGNKIFIDDFGWAWLEFPELIKYMKKRQAPHYIEAKASGKSSKQTLVGQGIPAIEIPVTGGDKEARANMATPYAESGMVHIRQSMAEIMYSDSKQGILNFPRGAYADLADTLAQCLQRLGTKKTISSSDGREREYDDD